MIAVVGIAAAAIVLKIAIPKETGARVGHIGIVKHKLATDCMLRALAGLDAGSEIVRWREGARVVDARIDFSGTLSELWMTQREKVEGWELVVEVRRFDGEMTAETAERAVESVTRNVAIHVLKQCADRAGWDGGVTCERREKGEACLGP